MKTLHLYQIVAAVCLCGILSTSAIADDDVRIFTLENSDCGEMAALLSDLTDGDLAMGVDGRTNSLVISAEKETLALIEAILTKLDSTADHPRGRDRHEHHDDAHHAHHDDAHHDDAHHDDAHHDHEHGEHLEEAERREREELEEQEERERLEREEIEERERLEREEQEERERLEREEQEEREEEEVRLLHREEELELGYQRRRAEQEIQLLKRKLEMYAAEAELQRMELESELNSVTRKAEIVSIQMEGNRDRLKSDGAGREKYAILGAELEVAKGVIEVKKRKLKFHNEHIAPMRQLEIEMELNSKQHLLELLQARTKATPSANAKHQFAKH